MKDGLTFPEAATYMYVSTSFSKEAVAFVRSLPGSGVDESRPFTEQEILEMDKSFGALKIQRVDAPSLEAPAEADLFTI